MLVQGTLKNHNEMIEEEPIDTVCFCYPSHESRKLYHFSGESEL